MRLTSYNQMVRPPPTRDAVRGPSCVTSPRAPCCRHSVSEAAITLTECLQQTALQHSPAAPCFAAVAAACSTHARCAPSRRASGAWAAAGTAGRYAAGEL
eukprot:scaffold122631_cov69-Phaeocystis_antarctica.AAC.4